MSKVSFASNSNTPVCISVFQFFVMLLVILAIRRSVLCLPRNPNCSIIEILFWSSILLTICLMIICKLLFRCRRRPIWSTITYKRMISAFFIRNYSTVLSVFHSVLKWPEHRIPLKIVIINATAFLVGCSIIIHHMPFTPVSLLLLKVLI